MRLKLFIVWTEAKKVDIFYSSTDIYDVEAGTCIDLTLKFNTSMLIKPDQYI